MALKTGIGSVCGWVVIKKFISVWCHLYIVKSRCNWSTLVHSNLIDSRRYCRSIDIRTKVWTWLRARKLWSLCPFIWIKRQILKMCSFIIEEMLTLNYTLQIQMGLQQHFTRQTWILVTLIMAFHTQGILELPVYKMSHLPLSLLSEELLIFPLTVCFCFFSALTWHKRFWTTCSQVNENVVTCKCTAMFTLPLMSVGRAAFQTPTYVKQVTWERGVSPHITGIFICSWRAHINWKLGVYW